MDILLTELGSGGEIVNRNNDVVTTTGFENETYIAMFGGNRYWANGLTLQGDSQFVATTEETLRTNPLTSAGLIAIENAMMNDLKYLENITGTDVSVSVKIPAPNRLDAEISISGQIFYLNWNPDESFLKYSLIE